MDPKVFYYNKTDKILHRSMVYVSVKDSILVPGKGGGGLAKKKVAGMCGP